MSAAAPVIWRPFPGFQTRALAAAEFEVLAGGAKGPGKSDLICIRPLRQVHHPRYKALVLRETYGELQEILDRMTRYYEKLPERPFWHGGEMRWKWPSGATIEVGYCRTVEDARRRQGHEPTEVLFDEIGNIPDERVWTTLMAEVRSPVKELHRSMFGTANPGKAGHPWLLRRFVKPTNYGARVVEIASDVPGVGPVRTTRRFVPGTVFDNPVYSQDGQYMAQLYSLPERDRRALLFGDWDVAEGMALDELDERVHIIRPFAPPVGWPMFVGFDWGFQHPFCAVLVTVSEDGDAYVVDSVWGRRQQDAQIAETLKATLPFDRITWMHCGGDVFNEIKARESTPSTFDRFVEFGIHCAARANTQRVNGLVNLRKWLAWRGNGPDGRDTLPRLRFMDTRGNRRLFEQLQGIVLDELNPEDALKVDADERGEGGDDGYDALRYAMASRPFVARDTFAQQALRSFEPSVLAYEAEQKRRHFTGTRKRPTFEGGELA